MSGPCFFIGDQTTCVSSYQTLFGESKQCHWGFGLLGITEECDEAELCTPPSSGRRLQDADTDAEPEGVAIWKTFLADANYSKPKTTAEAMVYVEHLVTSMGGTMKHTPPQNDETVGKDDDKLDVPWMDKIKTIHPKNLSYPIRVLPDSRSVHSVVSLAISVALSRNQSDPDIIAVQEEFVERACEFINDDCDVRWILHPVLDFDIRNDHTRRDDGLWVTLLLDKTIEASVDVIAKRALLCVSTNVGHKLDACDDISSSYRSSSDSTSVYRAIENALSGANVVANGQSLDVVNCVQSLECLKSVSQTAAESIGTLSFSSDALKNVSLANEALWSYAKTEAILNQTFSLRQKARRGAFDAHKQSITDALPSATEIEEGDDKGRRLEEMPDEQTNASYAISKWLEDELTDPERSLYLQTLQTVQLLNSSSDFEKISKAHEHAVRAWAATGGKVSKAGTGLCADPHVPLSRLDCKVYFHIVGSMIKKRRTPPESASSRPRRRKLSAEQHEQIHQHARRHLANVCCAKFENGREECGERYCEVHFKHSTAKRVGYILKRLADVDGHPVQEKMTPGIQAIIENKLLPQLHSDEECRRTNATGKAFDAPTPAECMARSLVHHAGKKYGLDPTHVRKNMQAAGINLGETIQSAHRALGFMKEVRGTGDRLRRSTKSVQKRRAATRAATLLRSVEGTGRKLKEEEEDENAEAEARRRLAVKGTESGDKGKRHGFAHSVNTIRGIRKQRKLSQKIMEGHFKRTETIAHSRRLKTSRQNHPTPRPETFRLDQLKQHFVNPFMAMDALEADEGSLMSRFAGGISKLNDVFDRFHDLQVKAETAQVEQERSRRLSDAPKKIEEFFNEVDKAQQTRYSNKTRRLQEQEKKTIDLPKTHALSWLHDLVDWEKTATEWTRVHDIVKQRDEARSNGRQMHEILQTHKTGYRWLDDISVYRHSVLGDALRRLAQRKQNGSDPHLPHIHSHKHASRFRRLSEGLFGPVIAAPYALWDTTIAAGAIKVPPPTDNVFTAAIKYVVYSTIGCYFTPPGDQVASSQFTDPSDPTKATDGETLKILRASDEKLCFPAIPVAVPTIPKFREWTKSQGLDYQSFTYEEFCTANGYQEQVRDFFGIDPSSDLAKWLGVAGVLRIAEASDSIEGLVNSAKADTGTGVIGYLLCSMVEFGGVLYVLCVLVILLALLPCLQVGGFFAGIIVDVVVLLTATTEKQKKEEDAEKNADQSQAAVAAKTTTTKKRRMGFSAQGSRFNTGAAVSESLPLTSPESGDTSDDNCELDERVPV